MAQLLAKLFVRFIGGPSNVVFQWLVTNIFKAIIKEITNAYEKYQDKKEVERIRLAEEALKKAKTEKEVDDALEDIARSSNN